MNPPIRLYLARHGRTEWNQARRFQGLTDVPLDDVGRGQARALAKALRGQIEAVIGSDLLRASETARIIASALELPLLAVDANLRERGYGVFEGLTREDCVAQYPVEWAARQRNRNFLAPGGETAASVIARMQRGLGHAVELLQGRHQSALVVGHGSSLRMFCEALSGHAEEPFDNMEFREVLHDDAGFALVRRRDALARQ